MTKIEAPDKRSMSHQRPTVIILMKVIWYFENEILIRSITSKRSLLFVDGDMHSHASPSSDAAFSEKSEPNHLIDYTSDCEKSAWAAEANSIDGVKYDSDEIDQRSALKKLRGSKVQTSSASVSDNWGSLQVQKFFSSMLFCAVIFVHLHDFPQQIHWSCGGPTALFKTNFVDRQQLMSEQRKINRAVRSL